MWLCTHSRYAAAVELPCLAQHDLAAPSSVHGLQQPSAQRVLAALHGCTPEAGRRVLIVLLACCRQHSHRASVEWRLRRRRLLR
jgi:hypothetical protein